MNDLFKQWLQHSFYQNELADIAHKPHEINDRFSQYVQFGTGGMRGKLGAGTNRINDHTIRRVAYGLAQQILAQGEQAQQRGVVIAYDTRHFSKHFAYETAGVLAAHHIQVYVFQESRPTPELSFAVRYLRAFAGVVITASHNPKQYNGFKLYGEDGAQLTPTFADEITAHMEQLHSIFTIPCLLAESLRANKYFTEILETIDDAYAEALQTLQFEKTSDPNIKIVYTPLHGSGLSPTMRGLHDFGFTEVHVVKEQAQQNGDFPTVAAPNPEDAAAFQMAIELGTSLQADLLLVTDPDADRLGVAVRDGHDYKLLTGNELGALLLHYILTQHTKRGTLPKNGALVKTIVTSELGTAIASHFGITTIQTLTGFKYIAEQITHFEKTNEHTFLFGYEESYGYLAAPFTRDKDAVQIALLTAEMAAYYKNENKTLLHILNELHNQFGHFQQKLLSFTFDGYEGQSQIEHLVNELRQQVPTQIANETVIAVEDYELQQRHENGETIPLALPKANVLKFFLADETWICVRPSGTEPKIKFYIGTKGKNPDTYAHFITEWVRKFSYVM